MTTAIRASNTAKKMDEAELKAVVGQKITGSLGFLGGMLSKERLDAEQRYKGEPYGDEQIGRSQVVARDVAEAVDSMLPALLKVFTSSDEVVRFDPRRPDQIEMAKQQTEYCNWVWYIKNPGFTVLHNWFKDALLKKLGVIKIYWDETTSVDTEKYRGLTDAEYQMISNDEDVEVVSHETRPALYGAPHIGVAMGAGAVPQQTVHDVAVRKSKTYGCPRVVNVPPEEFLIDHRAVTLEEAPFLCHRRKVTLTELKEMGFDPEIVDTLGPDGATDFNMERIERFKDEDSYPYRDDNYVDPSMREVWINECHVKIDFDGDGYAERRLVILAGESVYTLLENEEEDTHPFATLTPIPMPHKVYGMSIADQTADLQRIKTALFRGALDSIYLSVAPRMQVIEGQVNLDDLLNWRPGGVIRTKSKDALTPVETPPVSQEAFTMIEYIDAVREARTGVRRFNSSLDPDQINPLAKTATAAMLADSAANDRLALIARIFAETGIKDAFRRILELTCKHQDEKQIVRLRGRFVEFDPREWSSEMDITISVGLGTGNQDQELQNLMGLAQINAQIIQMQQGMSGPLITAENVYDFLMDLCRAGRLKFGERYYTDPKTAPPQPQQQKPDPKMVEVQGKLQLEQQKMQMKQQEQQQDLAHEQARMRADLQIEQAKAQHEMEMDRQRAGFDMQLENMKALHARQLEEMRIGHQAAMDEHVTKARAKALTMGIKEEEPPKPTKRRVTVGRGADGRISHADIEDMMEQGTV